MDFNTFLIDFDPFLIDFDPFLKCQYKDQKWIQIHQKCQNQSKLAIFFEPFDLIGQFLIDFEQNPIYINQFETF